jgi:hypothetical protein
MTETKVCAVCGRRFGWRRKWKSNWSEVRHCSTACRRRRAGDRRLEHELLALLDERPRSASICPSELARRLRPEGDDWRALMEPVRSAARRLFHAGEIDILQGGRRVDPDRARGPVRYRRIR